MYTRPYFVIEYITKFKISHGFSYGGGIFQFTGCYFLHCSYLKKDWVKIMSAKMLK